MKNKEHIDQFKRELKSIPYYEAKLKEYQEQLLELHKLMYEPKTIQYGEKIGKGTYNLVALIYEEEQIINQKQAYQIMYENIIRKLNRANEHDKQLLLDIYIQKHSYEKKALLEHLSPIQLKRNIDHLILELVKDDTRYI